MTATLPPLRARPAWGRPVALGAVGLAAAVLLSSDEGPVLCPFRRCTGYECPGCGMTRSAGRVLRGDVGGGFAAHPLGPLILAQLVVVAALVLVRPGWVRFRAVLTVLIVNAVVIDAVWVVRLARGDLVRGDTLWPF
jgi:hypothetical protein